MKAAAPSLGSPLGQTCRPWPLTLGTPSELHPVGAAGWGVHPGCSLLRLPLSILAGMGVPRRWRWEYPGATAGLRGCQGQSGAGLGAQFPSLPQTEQAPS